MRYIPLHQIQLMIESRFSQQQISEDLTLTLTHCFDQPKAFEKEDFEAFTLEEILIYLRSSHDYYKTYWIPKIENSLLQLNHHLKGKFWSVKLLNLFFASYKKELIEHMEEEEDVLFSFVDFLLKGEAKKAHAHFIIDHFLQSHNDNVIIHLSQLKEDLLKFDAELKNDLMIEVLFHQIELFQRDLMIHGLIEDHVFVQKVQQSVQDTFPQLS